MKPATALVASLLALGLSASLAAQETNPPASVDPRPMPVAATPVLRFTEHQIVETWGWIIAQEKNVAKIEINQAELSAFLRGVAAGFKGQAAPYDLDKIYPDVERVAKARREKVVRAITEKNEAAAKAFFADLKKNTNVVKMPNGLRYQIIKPGNGPYPKPTQTVNVHFIARLIDGTEFNQMGPYDVVMVANRSLPFSGWIEGMQRINKGGAIKFFIPPPLSETEAFKWGIPPGSTMIFEVELLDLKATTPDALADALLPPPPELEPPPPSGYTELQVIETWGWNLAKQTRIANLGLSEAELSWLTNGLVAGVKGQPPPCDLEKIYPAVGQFVHDRWEKARFAFQQKQHTASESFFSELKKKTNVVELASGLRYEILKPGKGPYPKLGKTVKITYVGRLLDGRVFDRTQDDESIDIWICDHPPQWMIPGWIEGLQKINNGGKIKLYVPPSLGYGDQSVHGVPPYSTLIFEIDVLDIKDTPPPDDAVPGSKATPVPEKK